MDPVKVLHIIDSLNVGGTENRCLEIVEGLDRRPFSCHLIYLDGGGPLKERLKSLQVPHQEIRVPSVKSPLFLREVGKLYNYMKCHGIKVVQTYGFYSNIPGILAARIASVPVIVASRRDMGQLLTPAQRG